MPKKLELTGKRFGRWIVIEEYGIRTKCGEIQWICKCDCGKDGIVSSGSLNCGNSKSCGCFFIDQTTVRLTTHGCSKKGKRKREYDAWMTMRYRCNNPNSKSYSNYGGRGIIVCDRWNESFEDFYKDMGSKPTSKHSLDRINNDGPYAPYNCRWDTNEIQSRNKRSNRWVEFEGIKLIISDWAKRLGITHKRLSYHLSAGKGIKEIITILEKNK